MVTQQFYRLVFGVRKGDVNWNSAEEVQEFLDEETAESDFDSERYGVLYNQRCIEAIPFSALRDQAQKSPHTPEELLASHAALYSPAVKEFGKIFHRHLDEMQMLRAIREKWYCPHDNRFKMRGKTFHVNKAKGLIKNLEDEIEADIEWLREFDTKVFVTYYEMALQLDRDKADELFQRYRFHHVMESMWRLLQDHRAPMMFMFDFLANLENNQLDEYMFHVLIEVFRQAYEAVAHVLDEAEMVKFPELANMPAGKPIRGFLLKERLAEKPSHFEDSISNRWLAKFANQFQDVERRLNRLHFKSLGNILALQESIGELAVKKWCKKVTKAGAASAG
jgi:hypothetical protein